MDGSQPARGERESGRMDAAEVEAFLERQGTGVLSLADDSRAYAVPISFGYDDGSAYFGYYRFGDRGRKEAYTEATERACLVAYEVESRFDWASVLAFGELRPVRQDDWTAVGAALDDNARSPELSTAGDRRLGVGGYELPVEEATGLRGPGWDPDGRG